MRRFAMFASLLLLVVNVSSQTAPKREFKTVEELDRFLSQPVPDKEKLASCETAVQKWKDWADVNVPRYNEMLAENERLKSRPPDLTFAIAALALGIGIASIHVFVRWFRRVRPIAREKKQLLVLLSMALWISGTALVNASDPKLSIHPINLLAAVIVYSLPALLFSGIALWWFSKQKLMILWPVSDSGVKPTHEATTSTSLTKKSER